MNIGQLHSNIIIYFQNEGTLEVYPKISKGDLLFGLCLYAIRPKFRTITNKGLLLNKMPDFSSIFVGLVCHYLRKNGCNFSMFFKYRFYDDKSHNE